MENKRSDFHTNFKIILAFFFLEQKYGDVIILLTERFPENLKGASKISAENSVRVVRA